MGTGALYMEKVCGEEFFPMFSCQICGTSNLPALSMLLSHIKLCTLVSLDSLCSVIFSDADEHSERFQHFGTMCTIFMM